MFGRSPSGAATAARSMGAVGLWVVGRAAWHAITGTVPAPEVMGAVGVLALAANAGVALLLYRYRTGDSNMRSVWICTRNDMIGNAALLIAASGVVATGRGWPDAVIALGMAALALTGAAQIVRQATGELLHGAAMPMHPPTAARSTTTAAPAAAPTAARGARA